MRKLTVFGRPALLGWRPVGAGLSWLLNLSWWWLLGLFLRRNLRSALGRAGGAAPGGGPAVRPRRRKVRLSSPFPPLA